MKRILAFDSGVGGLTALAPLLKKYKNLEVIYLGDLAHLPYGTKSPERIRDLTQRNLRWLFENNKNADLALVACNTASAHSLDIAQEIAWEHHVPLLGVLEPGCREALRIQTNRVIVLATSATVRSESYLRALKNISASVVVEQKACPLFVPLVEDELMEGTAAELISKRYLDPLSLKKGDTVLLGCTHYPFLHPMLEKLYPDLRWVDAGAALLHDPRLQQVLESSLHSQEAQAQHRIQAIFTDGDPQLENKFKSYLKKLSLEDCLLNVRTVLASELSKSLP